MTDHNADAGKKVEPCQLCGKEPIYHATGVAWYPHELDPVCKCFAVTCADGRFDPDEWNATQRAILAQRRKDFEAGVAFANHQEMGSGKPTFELFNRDRFPPTFMDDEGDDIDAFSFYLASTRK